MKRVIIILVFALLSAFAFAQTVGNKVYKEVSVNGEKVSKWLKVYSITGYDDRGNEIHRKCSNGFECWNEYDNKGNKIHSKYGGGLEEWYEYDNKGNMIHFKSSNSLEELYEYTFWDNGKVKTKTEYSTF